MGCRDDTVHCASETRTDGSTGELYNKANLSERVDISRIQQSKLSIMIPSTFLGSDVAR